MQNQKPKDMPEEKPAADEKAAGAPRAETPAPETAPKTAPETAPDGRGSEPAAAEESAETEGEGPTDPVVELLGEIEVLRGELAKMKDQALRAMADAENTRRRSEREKSDALKYASLPLLRDLVKVADNISRALLHGEPESEEAGGNAKALREGVALTEKELLAAFTRHGVARIDPAGAPFDPERHEAMFEVPDGNAEPGTIVQVLEPGWLLHDRLIRPARVGVAKKP